ncbi:MAG: hypothetical protein COA94_02000 [Rickettsiales bacterium]|nr:MAG: hypothetical protein COA94_02000 [Rickettsiales bacterium]
MQNKTTKSHFALWQAIIALMIILNIQTSSAKDIAGGNIVSGNISKKIKSYISNIGSIAVEFKQTDQTGSKAFGMLIIDKPYKFRCNYYRPFPIVIVGNKNYVSVYDYEMGHLSRIKTRDNIFNFLLVDQIDFDSHFEVLLAKEHGNNYIIRLKHNNLNKVSEISFNKKSKHITGMKIFEDNNVITLTFGKTVQIKDAARKLFTMKDPDIFGKPERFNRAKLEKNFKKAS